MAPNCCGRTCCREPIVEVPMKFRTIQRFCLAVALWPGAILAAADAPRSGPPVGEELPGTFEPVYLTGPDAGRKTCVLCEYGESPVVMVFAREVSEPLTKLIKRLDAVTAQHKGSSLGSTVIFLSNDETLAKQARQFAEKEKIEHTVLRTYQPEGPKGYGLAKDVDLTVVLFTDRVVKANHSFKKGELKDKNMDTILADVAKIIPGKK
jgi:hypothetical protein